MSLCYNQGEPGRVGSTGTGSNHLLPLEGKQMAEGSINPHWATRHWPLQAKLDYYSIPEPTSGCLLWVASCDDLGYGFLKWQGRVTRAHRLSWRAHKGPIPDGKRVLHKCDVPGCINPAHLFLGTDADNSADRDAKKRRVAPRGDDHPNAKLTTEQVLAIRLDPRRAPRVAKEFGITRHHVSDIRRGRSWKHLAIRRWQPELAP